MKNEEWRDVVGYEGLYQVSNQGRVKSLERKVPHCSGGERIQKERILKQATTYNGYLLVSLCAGGKPKKVTVHRLVCEAFHKNHENKPCVNHIDENKTNNAASNLEWCTYEENNNHGTHKERVAKSLSKPVAQCTKEGGLVKTWSSLTEIGKQTGFSIGNISQVTNGNRKQAYGFIWKYI